MSSCLETHGGYNKWVQPWEPLLPASTLHSSSLTLKEPPLSLNMYKSNLLYYGRQIDDILIIWHPTEPNLTFTDFYNDLNNQCNLSWTTSQLQQSVNFLDLTISINPITNTISTKTYYKPMHLFNYIPPHSAQAPGILKSLIYGLFQCYYHQNTSHLDFLSNIKL